MPARSTAELAHELSNLHARGRGAMSPELRALIDHGRGLSAGTYLAARAARERYRAALVGVLEAYDAILTPAAPGEAPTGLAATGNPAFCTLWTLRAPSLTLPAYRPRRCRSLKLVVVPVTTPADVGGRLLDRLQG